MKSPFPGMDPYLEQYWRDVHHRLCTYACDALQPQVRPALVARIEERLIVETDAGDERSIYPDVKVVERREREPAGSGRGTATAVLPEPFMVTVEDEAPTEGFITIIDPTTGGKLVTVIEFLSPSNKLRGRPQTEYLQKRYELVGAGVSLVEIDLLRAGQWILRIPLSRVPTAYRTPYRVCIHRGWKFTDYALYAIRLDQPLPPIPIPLREHDKEATLDLQALIDQTYRNGAYDFIDYSKPPVPPLEGPDAQWAQHLLQAASSRS